jgi:hypothetical protein
MMTIEQEKSDYVRFIGQMQLTNQMCMRKDVALRNNRFMIIRLM